MRSRGSTPGIIILLLLILIIVLIAIMSGHDDLNDVVNPTGFQPFPIPDGYDFIDCSAYGKIRSFTTCYLRNRDTPHEVRKFADGKLGDVVIEPEGYTFVGASAYGEFTNFTTYYYRRNGTNLIYSYQP